MSANQRPSLIKSIIVCGLFTYGVWYTQGMYYDRELFLVPVILAFFSAMTALQCVFLFLFLIPQFFRHRKARRPTGKSGTGGWATNKEIKKAGLRKKDGFFIGMKDKKPIFVDIESSGLVLSPAGGGKTNRFVVPALCHVDMSMFVPDLKGTLACMTKNIREKTLKHDVYCVNPAGLYQEILGEASCYNPLQILIDEWQTVEGQKHLFSDAQAMSKQLHPEPPSSAQNEFFRNGSRKFLTFAFLYLVIMGVNPTLAAALSLLSDIERLQSALMMARTTSHLQGDLSRLAGDILTKFAEGDPKQIDSFREGAVQSLDVFSPSGVLAQSTSRCDFRFRDLRDKKCTVYLIADPTRMKVYEPWLGLLSWCALTELIRVQNKQSVCFLCDEITNFKIDGLPAMLTQAREFKIKIWLIVQELEQWALMYGRESMETLLSQTEVQVFFGTRSHKTTQYISAILGEESIKSINHNIGVNIHDPVTRSLSEGPRKLLTADEVRRFDDTILMVRDMRPIRVTPIGYNEVKPWASEVGINPLFGKPYKGKTRLRL